MAVRLISPVNSFVQFNESSFLQSCEFPTEVQTLPVFADDDVYFQFVIETDTKEEADALCDLQNALINVGIALECDEDTILDFDEKPERYRLDNTHVLYNWMHGFPDFTTVVNIGQCFFIKITIQGVYTIFDNCSNTFQRIGEVCNTSVIDYTCDDSSFGFDYCGGTMIGDIDSATCAPLYVEFTNKATLTIPYTAELLSKYGEIPDVQVWIYNEFNELTNAGIVYTFDNFPPSEINFDFGGFGSGVIKIS